MLAAVPEANDRQAPLEIDVAADGAEALDALHRDSPDLVLLDVVLPDMDGWQVLAQKQQDAALRDIPVIMVSAQDHAGQPMVSEAIAATLGGGLSSSQLLRCTLGLSSVLWGPT
jgi:CheY-like chemotaxis protein